jgi:hypothetical protein
MRHRHHFASYLSDWFIPFLLFSSILLCGWAIPPLNEHDRVAEYHRMNYTWPLAASEFIPPTEGWTNLLQRRLAQADLLSADENSYDAYIATLTSVLVHNYSTYGWGITRAPPSTLSLVQEYIHSSISALNEITISELPLEQPDEISIDTMQKAFRPKMLELPASVSDAILQAVLPIVEAWAGGIRMVPFKTYGLRIYQNTSRLFMHLDKRDTHIISGILHISHDTQNPWPLFMEDFTGTTNELHLEPGDLLLYESSKCWHGRPRRMVGAWYTSLFLHYHPINAPPSSAGAPVVPFQEYMESFEWRLHHRVPPHWNLRHENPDYGDVENLVMPDTFAYEPSCPDEWCLLQDSIMLQQPTPQEHGKVITSNGEVHDLQLEPRHPSLEDVDGEL